MTDGIDLNVCLPMIKNAFDESQHIDAQAKRLDISLHLKKTALEEGYNQVKAIGFFGPMINTLLPRLEVLVKSCINLSSPANVDFVLGIMESPSDYQLRSSLRSSWVSFVSQTTEMEGVSADSEQAKLRFDSFAHCNEMAKIDADICISTQQAQTLLKGYSPEFRDIASQLEQELISVRNRAKAAYLCIRYTDACKLGRVQGQLDSIDTTYVNGSVLSMVEDELSKLNFTIDNSDQISLHIQAVVSFLKELRIRISQHLNWYQPEGPEYSTYKSLVEMTSLYLNSSRSPDIPAEILHFFEDAKAEMDLCLSVARLFYATNALRSALAEGCISGTLGSVCIAEISTLSLERAVSFSQDCKNELPVSSTAKLENLTDFSILLIRLRRAFVVSSLLDVRATMAEIEGFNIEIADCSEIVNYEIEYARSQIEYASCVEALESSLKPTTEMYYFEFGHDEALLESADYIIDVNQDEDYNLNSRLLETGMIVTAIEAADTMKRKMSEKLVLPQYFDNLFSAAHLICDVRKSVAEYLWEQAEAYVHEITENNLHNLVSIISTEVTVCGASLLNAMLLERCKKAFRTCRILGEVGLPTLEYSDMNDVGTVVEQCRNKGGMKSKKGEILLSALVIIRDIRSAIRVYDWGAVNEVLARADQTKMCGLGAEEIARAHLEVMNITFVREFEESFISERLSGDPGSINEDAISIDKLSRVLHKVQNVDPKNVSQMVSHMSHLGHVLLEGRQLTKEGEFSRLNDILDEWSDQLHSVKEIIQEFEREKLQIFKSVVFGQGSMDQPSLEDFTTMLRELELEYKLITDHFDVYNLENTFLAAFKENTINMDMIGKIDTSAVKIDTLSKALKQKAELDVSGLIMPLKMNALYTAGQYLLKIRTAVINNLWETLGSLIAEARAVIEDSRFDTELISGAYLEEIDIFQCEVDNRWILKTIGTALQVGCLRNDLVFETGQPVPGVVCENLRLLTKDKLTVTPKTVEAIEMVNSVDVILSLREMICVENVSWDDIGRKVQHVLDTIPVKTGNHSPGGKVVRMHDTLIVHPLAIIEIETFQSVAQDQKLTEDITKALQHGAATGKSGALDLSQVTLFIMH